MGSRGNIWSRAAEVAAATPDTRNRYVDFLRALSICAVVVGHWLIGLPVGYLLCFRLGRGAAGLWIGLSCGLILIGLGLLVVWALRARQLRAGQTRIIHGAPMEPHEQSGSGSR